MGFSRRLAVVGLLAICISACGTTSSTAKSSGQLNFTVGVLSPLAGGSGVLGLEWDQAARLAVQTIQLALVQAGLSSSYQINVATEDDNGDATQGVQGATKLVSVDHANMLLTVYSSVTIPVAQAVSIPNNIVQFAAGSSPAISNLHDPLFFRTVPSDALQAAVLAKVIGQALGAGATINVAASNESYGTGLAASFQSSWTKAGGKIGKQVLWNLNQATYDTEAQQVMSGNPDGWLMAALVDYWPKLYPALVRTGKFNPQKTFGGELFFCSTSAVPGMRATSPDVSTGAGYPLFKKIWDANARANIPYVNNIQPEAFDDTIIAFLAAVAAHSTRGPDIAKKVRSIVTPVSGVPSYGIDKLADAIKALSIGNSATYVGATGVQGFDVNGDPTTSTWDVATSTGTNGQCDLSKFNYKP